MSAHQRTAGATDAGLLAYTDGMGRLWSGKGAVTFDEWGLLGTSIEETYAVPITLVAHPDGGPTLLLAGSFRVCHAFDGIVVP